LAGTGSALFSGGLFLEAAQIWRELAFFSGRNLINEGARQKNIANTSTTIRKIYVCKIIC
jgi:hypothetical protein